MLILGELDSIICREHPCADRETGAVCLSHGADYMIENPELACVSSAAWQLEMPRLRNAISRYREYLKRLPTGGNGRGRLSNLTAALIFSFFFFTCTKICDILLWKEIGRRSHES